LNSRKIRPDVRAILSTGYALDEVTQGVLDEGMQGLRRSLRDGPPRHRADQGHGDPVARSIHKRQRDRRHVQNTLNVTYFLGFS